MGAEQSGVSCPPPWVLPRSCVRALHCTKGLGGRGLLLPSQTALTRQGAEREREKEVLFTDCTQGSEKGLSHSRLPCGQGGSVVRSLPSSARWWTRTRVYAYALGVRVGGTRAGRTGYPGFWGPSRGWVFPPSPPAWPGYHPAS